MCCRAYRKVEDISQNKGFLDQDLILFVLNRKQARCTVYGHLRGMMPYRILSTGSRTAKPCRSIPTRFLVFNPYPANVENMVSSYNASKWQMGLNWAFKGLIWYSSHGDASIWTPQHCSIFKLRFPFNITRSKILYLFEQEEPLVIEIRLHREVNAISSFFRGTRPPHGTTVKCRLSPFREGFINLSFTK